MNLMSTKRGLSVLLHIVDEFDVDQTEVGENFSLTSHLVLFRIISFQIGPLSWRGGKAALGKKKTKHSAISTKLEVCNVYWFH